MTNLVRFPGGRRIPAATIPRAEFERLAELALDVVDQIVALLNDADGNADHEDDGNGESSLGAPAGGPSQRTWAAGGDQDRECE